jgi:hypothetical protein
MFGHLKERIKIHRGLDKNRKKKAIKFLLKNWGRKVGFWPPIFLIMPGSKLPLAASLRGKKLRFRLLLPKQTR